MSEVETPVETTSTAAPKETVLTPPAAVESKPAPIAEAPKGNEGKEVIKAEPEIKVEPTPVVETPKSPEKYEFKTRKDSPLLKADLEEIEVAAKAKGLSQEDAQKLVEGREADHDRFFSRQQDLYRKQMDDLKKATESDPEIAGPDGKSFKENVELAHRGLKMFADDSVMKFLAETGLGNSPALTKMFMRIGKRFANDKAILDGKSSSPTKGKSREEKLFPSHSKKE